VVTKAYSEVAEANAVVVTEANLVVVAVMREGGMEGDPEEEVSVVAAADSEVRSEVASGAVTGAGVVVVTEGSEACPVAVAVVVGTTPV
jgi:hypothetical protein